MVSLIRFLGGPLGLLSLLLGIVALVLAYFGYREAKKERRRRRGFAERLPGDWRLAEATMDGRVYARRPVEITFREQSIVGGATYYRFVCSGSAPVFELVYALDSDRLLFVDRGSTRRWPLVIQFDSFASGVVAPPRDWNGSLDLIYVFLTREVFPGDPFTV